MIKYASWEGEENVQRVIAAFEKTHPNIKVVHDKRVTWPWNEKLAAVAASGDMPDVTWLFGVPVGVINGWLEDLTPYLAADPDYNPARRLGNLDATASYEGGIYALPHSLFIFAIFLNLDLFEQENVPIPSANWTVEEFRRAAVALTDFNEHQFGLRDANPMRETLPSSFDPKLGWNTWDGEKFNFSSAAFRQTVEFIDRLQKQDKVAVSAYRPEDQENWFGKGKDPWVLGKVGMIYDGTWMLGGFSRDLRFRWDVRPIPAARGQRIPLITDYAGISRSSKHKKEAFEFLKWLTYSKEGWMERVKPEWPLGSVPLINDPDVWNAWLSRPDVPPGMREMLRLIPNGTVDPIKYLPGYLDALAIYHDSFRQVNEGKVRFEDIAPDMDRRMNAAYADAVRRVKEAVRR